MKPSWACRARYFVLSMFLAAAATAAPGERDPTFGAGTGMVSADLGRLPTPPQLASHIAVTAIQRDDKIVVATSNLDFRLARYNPDGSLDATFGGDGIVTTDLGGDNVPRAMAIQANGKIVIAGTNYYRDASGFGYYPDGVILTRYTKNGWLDRTFGINGVVILDPRSGYFDVPYALALQLDGKIVVAGQSYRFSGGRYSSDGLLLRLRDDGRLDEVFATQGVALAGASASAWKSVAVQADRKITVAGTRGSSAVAGRYTKTGAPDVAFGVNGSVVIPMGGSASAAVALALQADGKVAVAGYTSDATGTYDYVLARLRRNGTLDLAFGDNGMVTTNVSALRNSQYDFDIPHSLVIQPDGKFIVGGESGFDTPDHLTLLRYRRNGILDGRFGSNGLVTGPGSFATGLAVAADGKLVAAGVDRTASTPSDRLVVLRYKGDQQDVTPDPMAFRGRSNVAPNTLVTSEAVQIAGLKPGTAVPLRIKGGRYSVNDRPFTALPGWVRNGDTVRLSHTSKAANLASTTTVLAVGGVEAPNNPTLLLGSTTSATFTSVTAAAP